MRPPPRRAGRSADAAVLKEVAAGLDDAKGHGAIQSRRGAGPRRARRRRPVGRAAKGGPGQDRGGVAARRRAWSPQQGGHGAGRVRRAGPAGGAVAECDGERRRPGAGKGVAGVRGDRRAVQQPAPWCKSDRIDGGRRSRTGQQAACSAKSRRAAEARTEPEGRGWALVEELLPAQLDSKGRPQAAFPSVRPAGRAWPLEGATSNWWLRLPGPVGEQALRDGDRAAHWRRGAGGRSRSCCTPGCGGRAVAAEVELDLGRSSGSSRRLRLRCQALACGCRPA